MLEQLNAWGFPSRMGPSKAMAQVLAEKRAEQEGDPELTYLDNQWATVIQGFQQSSVLNSTDSYHMRITLSTYGTTTANWSAYYTGTIPTPKTCTKWLKKGLSSAIREKQKLSVEQDGAIQKLYRMEHVRCLLSWNAVVQEYLCFPRLLQCAAYYIGWYSATNHLKAVFA